MALYGINGGTNPNNYSNINLANIDIVNCIISGTVPGCSD